ncbi:hypothetical protein M422DRAFT_176867, partial [Sphaerobolus stellatus SS14]
DDLADFVTYAASLFNRNLVTNFLSIGSKTPLARPDSPAPAIVGGLDTHAVFEGNDASTTGADAFFGDNHSFNETLLQEYPSLILFSNKFGARNYNVTRRRSAVAFAKTLYSIATNPQFSFVSPRYYTAYAESVFPTIFFVDGRVANCQFNTDGAPFISYNNISLLCDFFRYCRHLGRDDARAAVREVFAAHPIEPGANQGAINTFTLDPELTDFSDFCKLNTHFVNISVKGLYPKPTGVLLNNLNTNINFFFQPLATHGHTQVSPFGQS